MKLRLLIISILLAGYLYPQSFDWNWFEKRHNASSDLPLVISFPTRWSDSTKNNIYDSGWVRLERGKYLRTGYSAFYDIRGKITDSFRVIMNVALLPTVTCNTYFCGNGASGLRVALCLVNGGMIEFSIKPTIISDWMPICPLPAGGDTTFHIYEFRGIKTGLTDTSFTITTYLDNSLVNTYTEVLISQYNPYTSSTITSATLAGMCLGTYQAPIGDGTYGTLAPTVSGCRMKWKSFQFFKNDTGLVYDFNNANTQWVIPKWKIHGVYPFPNLEDSTDRGTSTNVVFWNGQLHNRDTLEGRFVLYGLSGSYKNPYLDTTKDVSNFDFTYNSPTESFTLDVESRDDTGLYISGVLKSANDTNGTFPNSDTTRFISHYNTATGKWEALQYGLNLDVMDMSIMGNYLYATGTFTGAQGRAGAFNRVARYNFSTKAWDSMKAGVNSDGVSICAKWGKVVVNGLFTAFTQGGVTKTANCTAIWDTTTATWDTMGVGINSRANQIVPITISDSNYFVLCGGIASYTQNGITTPTGGIVWWNVVSQRYGVPFNIWTKYNGAQGTIAEVAYDTVNHWLYGVGLFDTVYIRGGNDTIFNCNSLFRYKQGVGLQKIGSGIDIVTTNSLVGTSLLIDNNILYIGGSFRGVCGFKSKNLAGINLITGTMIDLGNIPSDMRVEGIGHVTLAGVSLITIAGDGYHFDYKWQRGIGLYNPLLNP